MELIHISTGGADYWLNASGKTYRFEDHPHIGPVVLNTRTGEPLDDQPAETDRFWLHVTAWYRQGKRTAALIGQRTWCLYETHHQTARRVRKALRAGTREG